MKINSNNNNNNNRNEISLKKDLNIFIRKIDLKKSLFFFFDTLNALLSCNETKKDFIKTELFIEDKLSLFTVQTDEIRVNQILLNFISNSVKFTKRGKIPLIANFVNKKTKKEKSENKFFLKISVVETGIGISDEEQKRLLTEEIKLNVKHEFNQQGSGLGLSICANLIKLLNVKIEFSSKENFGSIFCVLIPVIKNTQQENNANNNNDNNNNPKVDFTLKTSDNRRIKASASFELDKISAINNSNFRVNSKQMSNLNKSVNLDQRRGLFDNKAKNFTIKIFQTNKTFFGSNKNNFNEKNKKTNNYNFFREIKFMKTPKRFPIQKTTI